MSGCRVSEGSRMFVEVILECRECTRTGKKELDGIRVRSRGRGGWDIRSGRSHIYHRFTMRTWINYFYLMPRLAPFVMTIDKHSSLTQDELWELLSNQRLYIKVYIVTWGFVMRFCKWCTHIWLTVLCIATVLVTNRGASVAAESFIQPSVHLLSIFHKTSAYLSFSMIYKTTFNLLKSAT